MTNATADTAFLVLDLQNDLVDASGKMSASGLPKLVAERRILENVARVIARARAVDVPVVYVGLGYREDYADVLSVAPRIANLKKAQIGVRGTWGAEFHASIAPQAGDVVFHKQCVNPFFNTPLYAWLARRNVRKLALSGVATNLVVESAARFADDAGIAVTVLSDCCASPNPQWHEFAVTNILPVFGRVTTSDVLLDEWK